MKRISKNILLIAVLTTLVTITPSIISTSAFSINYQNSNSKNSNSKQPIKLGVKITSPKDGASVSSGKLTIFGTSTDTSTTNCHPYADWNNKSPYQLATAQGKGGKDDYSKWSFTYTSKYHLITKGNTNELTAKFYCDDNHDKSTSAYNTINIVGK